MHDGVAALQCQCWMLLLCVSTCVSVPCSQPSTAAPFDAAACLTSQDDGNAIDPALCVVAYSMEQGN
jgi:hypothetical protein